MKSKDLFVVLSVLTLGFLFIFNTKGCQSERKHIISDIVGINRTVIVYANNGNIIKQYTGNFKIEKEGGFASFICKGKKIDVRGTIIIEEK